MRTEKFKSVNGGGISPQDLRVPAGKDGNVVTYEVLNVPDNVTKFAVTTSMSYTWIKVRDRYSFDFKEIGTGKIVN